VSDSGGMMGMMGGGMMGGASTRVEVNKDRQGRDHHHDVVGCGDSGALAEDGGGNAAHARGDDSIAPACR